MKKKIIGFILLFCILLGIILYFTQLYLQEGLQSTPIPTSLLCMYADYDYNWSNTINYIHEGELRRYQKFGGGLTCISYSNGLTLVTTSSELFFCSSFPVGSFNRLVTFKIDAPHEAGIAIGEYLLFATQLSFDGYSMQATCMFGNRCIFINDINGFNDTYTIRNSKGESDVFYYAICSNNQIVVINTDYTLSYLSKCPSDPKQTDSGSLRKSIYAPVFNWIKIPLKGIQGSVQTISFDGYTGNIACTDDQYNTYISLSGNIKQPKWRLFNNGLYNINALYFDNKLFCTDISANVYQFNDISKPKNNLFIVQLEEYQSVGFSVGYTNNYDSILSQDDTVRPYVKPATTNSINVNMVCSTVDNKGYVSLESNNWQFNQELSNYLTTKNNEDMHGLVPSLYSISKKTILSISTLGGITQWIPPIKYYLSYINIDQGYNGGVTFNSSVPPFYNSNYIPFTDSSYNHISHNSFRSTLSSDPEYAFIVSWYPKSITSQKNVFINWNTTGECATLTPSYSCDMTKIHLDTHSSIKYFNNRFPEYIGIYNGWEKHIWFNLPTSVDPNSKFTDVACSNCQIFAIVTTPQNTTSIFYMQVTLSPAPPAAKPLIDADITALSDPVYKQWLTMFAYRNNWTSIQPPSNKSVVQLCFDGYNMDLVCLTKDNCIYTATINCDRNFNNINWTLFDTGYIYIAYSYNLICAIDMNGDDYYYTDWKNKDSKLRGTMSKMARISVSMFHGDQPIIRSSCPDVTNAPDPTFVYNANATYPPMPVYNSDVELTSAPLTNPQRKALHDEVNKYITKINGKYPLKMLNYVFNYLFMGKYSGKPKNMDDLLNQIQVSDKKNTAVYKAHLNVIHKKTNKNVLDSLNSFITRFNKLGT